jgi:hypothetical protein
MGRGLRVYSAVTVAEAVAQLDAVHVLAVSLARDIATAPGQPGQLAGLVLHSALNESIRRLHIISESVSRPAFSSLLGAACAAWKTAAFWHDLDC